MNVCIYVHVLMYVCMNVSVNVCVCMYICLYARMYVYMCMCVCMYVCVLLNILQDSSFSNQITFILHILGVFSLPGRGFHQRVTLISSVPMTLDHVYDDVIKRHRY